MIIIILVIIIRTKSHVEKRQGKVSTEAETSRANDTWIAEKFDDLEEL